MTAAAQRVGERLLVDQGSAADVDDDRGLLHQRELRRADQIARRRGLRRGQHDDVGGGQQIVERGRRMHGGDAGRQRRVGVPSHARHRGAERREAHGSGAANAAKTDDQDVRAGNGAIGGQRAVPVGGRDGHAGSGVRHHFVLRPGALRLALEGERQAAEEREDEREHVLGNGLGREPAGVGHDHRAGDHLRIQHVADAGRGTVNPSQAPRRLQLRPDGRAPANAASAAAIR